MNTRTLCLAILSCQEASGYDIKKLSQDGVFSHFVDASFGSIYPALNKMEADQLVHSREEKQAGKPSSKIYSITENGQSELVSELSAPIKNDVFKSQFLLVALFAPFLDRATVHAAITSHKAYYEAELASCNQSDGDKENWNIDPAHLGVEWVGNYGRTVIEATLNFLNENEDKLLKLAGTALNNPNIEAAE